MKLRKIHHVMDQIENEQELMERFERKKREDLENKKDYIDYLKEKSGILYRVSTNPQSIIPTKIDIPIIIDKKFFPKKYHISFINRIRMYLEIRTRTPTSVLERNMCSTEWLVSGCMSEDHEKLTIELRDEPFYWYKLEWNELNRRVKKGWVKYPKEESE